MPFPNPFEYIAVLTSIVLALGITRILTGVGRMLQMRGRIRLYWVQLLWSANVFLWILLNWWILYRWHTYQNWTFFLLLFILASPIVAFLLSVLLVPDPLEEGTDLKMHYYANHRWFFILAALLPLLDAVDTALKGKQHFLDQGPIYVFTLTIIFVLCVTAAITKRNRFHAAFSIFFLVYILTFISINLSALT
jgi:hypothetical protein